MVVLVVVVRVSREVCLEMVLCGLLRLDGGSMCLWLVGWGEMGIVGSLFRL